MRRKNAFGNLSKNNLLLLGILVVLVVLVLVWYIFFRNTTNPYSYSYPPTPYSSSPSSSSSSSPSCSPSSYPLSSSCALKNDFVQNYTTLKINITNNSAKMNLPTLPSGLLTNFISTITGSMSSLTFPGIDIYTLLGGDTLLSSTYSYTYLKEAKLFNSTIETTSKFPIATLTLQYSSKGDFKSAYKKFTEYFKYILNKVIISVSPEVQTNLKLTSLKISINESNVSKMTELILPFFYAIQPDDTNNSVYFYNLNKSLPAAIGPVTGLDLQLATVYLFATADHINCINYGFDILKTDLSV